MANFRGYGDDAMKVAASQRQDATQRAGIAASERASQRSASVAMAGQREGAREFDERQKLAREELAQRSEQAGLNRSAELAEREAGRSFQAGQAELARQEGAAGRTFTAEQNALNRAQNADELALRERQVALNEATHLRLTQQWEQEQAVQKERMDQENAATLSALRFASTAGSPVPPLFLNAINEARGVAYGEPGSITGMFPIIDDKGNRYGFGVTEIDKDGKPIQKSKDPAEVLPKMFAQMKPEDAEELRGRIIAGNTTAFDDKMKLAAMGWQARGDLAASKEALAAQTAQQKAMPKLGDLIEAKKETQKAVAASTSKTEQDNLKKRLATIDATIESALSGGAPKSGNGKTAELNTGMIILRDERTGQERTFEDTPKARAAIKQAYGIEL